MKYRSKSNGAIIDVSCKVESEHWEPVMASRTQKEIVKTSQKTTKRGKSK